jgi:hypothetical protein
MNRKELAKMLQTEQHGFKIGDIVQTVRYYGNNEIGMVLGFPDSNNVRVWFFSDFTDYNRTPEQLVLLHRTESLLPPKYKVGDVVYEENASKQVIILGTRNRDGKYPVTRVVKDPSNYLTLPVREVHEEALLTAEDIKEIEDYLQEEQERAREEAEAALAAKGAPIPESGAEDE